MSQPIIAAAVAVFVVVKAMAAVSLAASADPALNPNQPNQSNAAPSRTKGRLCGRMGSLRQPLRLPSTSARASPAAPALACTTVPPAKSSAPRLKSQPLADQTQCAMGAYTSSDQTAMIT